MEKLYSRGEYKPLVFDEYVSIVADVLELLPPQMVIQRLTGDCPRDMLVAPTWTLDKQRVLTAITAELRRRDSWQGGTNYELRVTNYELKKIRNLTMSHFPVA